MIDVTKEELLIAIVKAHRINKANPTAENSKRLKNYRKYYTRLFGEITLYLENL